MMNDPLGDDMMMTMPPDLNIPPTPIRNQHIKPDSNGLIYDSKKDEDEEAA